MVVLRMLLQLIYTVPLVGLAMSELDKTTRSIVNWQIHAK